MLRDKYSFKSGYNNWGFLCSVLKDVVNEKTPKRPRNFGEQAALLNISVLREMNARLDRKLCTYKSTTSFTLKQSEALAMYLVYKAGGLPKTDLVMEIITTIDKQI